GGLNRIDRDKNTYTFYIQQKNNPQSLSRNFVYSIMEDHQGMLWVGTIKGLNRFDRYRETFKHYYKTGNSSGLSHNHVVKVLEDPSRDLWIGTYGGGLNRYYRQKGTFGYYRHNLHNALSLSHNTVTDIFQDRSGNLWIGTEGGGLNCLLHKKESFTRFQYTAGCTNCLSHNTVLSILESYNGIIWIGTRGGGLNCLNPETGMFTHFTMRDGLPSNIIYGILEDHHGNLWLSTNKGISRFNPHTKATRNFTPNDGIQGWEFNSRAFFKSRGGELFFGGLNGFNCFYPDQIKDNFYVPPIVITGIEVFKTPNSSNRSAHRKKHSSGPHEFTLSYDENIFSISFAALNFSQPEKNQYKFKMEGFTDDWIFLGNKTEATFTNLNPGQYTFHVRGSNNSGIWNNRGSSVVIIIKPPFWKTWWAKTLLLPLVAALTVLLHRWLLKNRDLRLKSEEKLKIIVQKYKLSKRESEIVELVIKGKTNKEIEDELFISLKTVKAHLYNIYQKLSVKNRLGLIHKFRFSSKN
ncbi:MAG: histidine kinase, partial [Candidatus Aminicenantes bacterium]|nr:histidine kinase [Candidatus Aminicenantes bacterium]